MNQGINKELVKKRFSHAAKSYDDYAVVQKSMAKKLICLLKEEKALHTARRILEIGCGTGYFTACLLKHLADKKLKDNKILITDISEEMLYMCKERMKAHGFALDNMDFMQLDGENIALTDIDLIVANAVFQWFNDLKSALFNYNKCLNKGGSIFFATFGSKTFNEIHSAFNNTVCSKKRFKIGQRFVSAEDIGLFMKESGFADVKVLSEFKRQHFKNPRELFKAIKKIGASNACEVSYLGKQCYKEFIEYYSKNFSDEQGVYCTYEIIYCYGRKM